MTRGIGVFRYCSSLLIDEDSPAYVHEPVDVVAVGVGDHNLGYVIDVEAGRSHRGRKLVVARDLWPRERHISRLCSLAGVDEPQRALVLNRPAVDRQRV